MAFLSPVRDNVALPTTPTTNSVYDILQNGLGRVASKQITLSANNASEQVDCFDFTGQVYVHALLAVVSGVTTMTNCTAAHFQVSDGGTPVALTEDITGLDMSNYALGALIAKTAPADTALSGANSDQVRVIEAAVSGEEGNGVYYPFLLNAKGGQTNQIRFSYATTNTPIAANITVICVYTPYPNSSLAAA